MDETLYDEFGNYIGPEIEEDDDDEEDEDGDLMMKEGGEGDEEGDDALARPEQMEVEREVDRQIVLNEDKKYYPEPEEVYTPVRN